MCGWVAYSVFGGFGDNYNSFSAAGRIANGGWLYLYSAPSAVLMNVFPAYQYPPLVPLLYVPLRVDWIYDHGHLGNALWQIWGNTIVVSCVAWGARRVAGFRGAMACLAALALSIMPGPPVTMVLSTGLALLAVSAVRDGRGGIWAGLSVLSQQTGAGFAVLLAASRQQPRRFILSATVMCLVVLVPIMAAEPRATFGALGSGAVEADHLTRSIWAAVLGWQTMPGEYYRSAWLLFAVAAAVWLRRVTGGRSVCEGRCDASLGLVLSVLCLVAAARVLLFEANLHYTYWAQASAFGVLAAHLTGRRTWPVLAAAAGVRVWTADPIDGPVGRLYDAVDWHPNTHEPIDAVCWWLVLLPLALALVWPAVATVRLAGTSAAVRQHDVAMSVQHPDSSSGRNLGRGAPTRWTTPRLRACHAVGATVLAGVCLLAAVLPSGAYLRLTPAVLWDGKGPVVRSEQQRLFDDYVAQKTDLWTENNAAGPGIRSAWTKRYDGTVNAAVNRCDSTLTAECEADVAAVTATAARDYWASLLAHIDETAHITNRLNGYPDTGPLRTALERVVDSIGSEWHTAWEALTECRAIDDATDCRVQQAAYDARHAAASEAVRTAQIRLEQFSTTRHEWFVAREAEWPQP